MLHFSKHELANGLKLIIHEDKTTPLVCINTLYNVGAKFENPNRTGIAHLFEHLMFTGSKHAKNFDKVLEAAGGDNNAFTNNDITNYYETLPAVNIETAIFLEADRMQNLNLSDKSIKAQKSVVIEEFKERYLNQAYGDMDGLIRKMSFKTHPYRWSTIGISESHIAEASKAELLDFYHRYYTPNNAIITVAGNVNTQEVIDLIEKYFGNIPKGSALKTEIPQEKPQTEQRIVEHFAEVPQDAINISLHMPDRMHPDYYAMDLISDILSNGKSSRLYKQLVKGKKIFTELDAWIDGSIDAGLLQIFGHPNSKYSLKDAESALLESLQDLHENPVKEYECAKVANKAVSSWIFSGIPITNKAFNLAYFELLGDIGRINKETEFYLKTSHEQIQKTLQSALIRINFQSSDITPNNMLKPKIHKISEIKFLQQENINLQNGIKVSSFYNNDVNALKIDFVFPAGRVFQEKAFVSAMTNAIIREGSNQHPNSADIEEKLDYFGIFVQQRIETYWSVFSFYIPLMYLEKALPIIHEILFDPIIDQISLDFLKEKGKSGLIKQLKKPAFLAKQHAMKMLWGENHPMGYFPEPSDFDKLIRDDLLQFYNTYYKNSQFNIYVSGNFPSVFLTKMNTLFGQHPVEAILPEPMRFLKDRKSETLIQKEEKQVQTALYWTAPCIAPGHPDYFDFKIMNTVFGDYFGSRLMTNIREEKAYTYGIYSSISPKSTGTNISIQTEVGKAYLDDTIKQIDMEIDNMKTQLIDNEELELIQNYMSGELLSVFDGVFNHASVLRYLDEMNLDFGYYENYIKRIQSITPEAIREAAQKYLHSEMFHKVCIG